MDNRDAKFKFIMEKIAPLSYVWAKTTKKKKEWVLVKINDYISKICQPLKVSAGFYPEFREFLGFKAGLALARKRIKK